MARCNSCNKFVSYDEPEVSDNGIEASSVESAKGTVTFEITGTIEVKLKCAECGDDLKSADIDFEHTTDPVTLPEGFQLVEGSVSWTDNGPDGNTKTEGKGRGMKSFYGFNLDGTVEYQIEPVVLTDAEVAALTKEQEDARLDLLAKVERDVSLDVNIEDFVQASHMEEC